jgi:transposase-like protein
MRFFVVKLLVKYITLLTSRRRFVMAQYVSNEQKEKIIKEIRDEGKKVIEVAKENNVSTKTIYNWLRDGVKGDSSALEIARLKRELDAVYGVLGKVTAELKHPKK